MTLSVIIVSWNAKSFLIKCLESIGRQKGDYAIEVIVVDNASSDGSPEEVSATFPEVMVIRNEKNFGFAKANNIGISKSSGEYLLLINSDVEVEADCFGKMTAYMVERPNVGLLGPRVVGSNRRLQRSCMAYPSLLNALSRAFALDSALTSSKLFGVQLLQSWDHGETRPVEVINGCFWMVRRSAMDEVGTLDERFLIYGEDIDWCRRFNDLKWDVVFFHDASIIHYGGGSSSNAPVKFHVEMQRANYQYWCKHHSAVAAYLYLLISVLHNVIRLVGETIAFMLMKSRRTSAKYKIERSIAALKWLIGALSTGRHGVELRPAGGSL